jgi:hypothetical protein
MALFAADARFMAYMDPRSSEPTTYLDTFTRFRGTRLFAERRLYVDWTDTRPISESVP